MSKCNYERDHSHFYLWLAVYCLFLNNCVSCIPSPKEQHMKWRVDDLERKIEHLERTELSRKLNGK